MHQKIKTNRLTLGGCNLLQLHNIFMMQSLEQFDLPERSDGKAIRLRLGIYTLERNNLPGDFVCSNKHAPFSTEMVIRKMLLIVGVAG